MRYIRADCLSILSQATTKKREEGKWKAKAALTNTNTPVFAQVRRIEHSIRTQLFEGCDTRGDRKSRIFEVFGEHWERGCHGVDLYFRVLGNCWGGLRRGSKELYKIYNHETIRLYRGPAFLFRCWHSYGPERHSDGAATTALRQHQKYRALLQAA